jgi:hypothetical protein
MSTQNNVALRQDVTLARGLISFAEVSPPEILAMTKLLDRTR